MQLTFARYSSRVGCGMLSLTLALLAAQSAVGSSGEYPIGDIRNCAIMSPINQSVPLLRMEVLPGGGFDNLRNLDMGQVFFYNYSTCKVSSDGRYLLPDSVFLIPEQQSRVDVFSEFFDHWDNYTSTTSNSINVDVSTSYADINAKFSTEWQSVKEKQFNSKSKTTRVQVRHKLYKVHIQPNSQLHPNLKALLFDIMANLQRNNTHYANYLADLVIRDYGTHYVQSLDAGAVLSQIDHVSEKFVQSHQFDSTKITASASASFFSIVKFSTSFQHLQTNADTEGFTSNRTHSQVFTFGGPPFRPGFTVDDWEDGIRDALVPIDRAGDPLYYAINPTTLPELVDSDSFEIQGIVFSATKRYYAANTVRGCTDPTADNFAFTANVDDGHCKASSKNSSFGGIYQSCTTSPEDPQSPYVNLCKTKNLNQVNTRTGGYSCPSGYTPIELYSASLTQQGERLCTFQFLFWCVSYKTIISSATYTTYWCAATGTVEPTDGYLFGGAFTSNQINPATSSMSCPMYFQEFRMGVDGIICASEEFELAFQFSIPFAGFESCRVGNPLTVLGEKQAPSSKWLHDCPAGFSKYLLMVENGCEISYCIKSGLFETKSLPPARRPPFSKHMHNAVYFDAPMILIGSRNKIWIKDDYNVWRIASAAEMEQMEAAMSSISPPPVVNESNTTEENPISNIMGSMATMKLSNGAVAAISVVTTLAFCTVIACAIFVGFSVGKRRKAKKGAESYENLPGSNCAINELVPNESHTTTT